MTAEIGQRLSVLQPSAIIHMSNIVREKQAAGIDVVSFSVGVPGFLPPAHVYEAARKALDSDAGDYLPGRGTKPLVEAFRAAMAERGFTYADTEVCAQVGGKGALFNIFLLLLNPGDEVVVPAPYWASYPEMIRIVGAVPVMPYAGADQDYKLTADQLRAAITPRTKVVLFNSPSNPTGMLYSKEETAAIAAVLAEYPDVWVISDDIYDKLLFNGERCPHLLDTQPGLKDRLLIVQSISKTYGMPGWRVGMVAGPKRAIDSLLSLTSQSHTNLPSVAMAAAAAAFGGDHSFLVEQRARLVKQRDMVLGVLAHMKGVECPVPLGAFYVFPRISCWFGKTTAAGAKLANDQDVCEALLNEARIACVPGGAFGDDQAIRISFAGKEPGVVEGLKRLVEWEKGLRD